MNYFMKKFMFLFLAGVLLFIVTACGSNADYFNGPADAPARYAREYVRGGNMTRSANRRGIFTRPIAPHTARRQPALSGDINYPEPAQIIPHSPAHPQGRVVEVPDSYTGYNESSPQVIPPTPYVPESAYHGTQTAPHSRANRNANAHAGSQVSPVNPPVSTQAPMHSPAPRLAPTVSEAGEGRSAAAHTTGELASHKTNFDAKDNARATNITRASNSINGKTVQPGEVFSYNQTVGPTIERRGYEESVIFVEGEKKKGFGGGVCQVSTTLSIAADEAGMKIIERHDHSRPVSYANEGDEAATSYGGIDFKFKNEKPYPVVIKSSVEGGTITVSIER